MYSSYATFNNFFISGGKKYNYNEKQCFERCVGDNRCFAVHIDSMDRCYVYLAEETGRLITQGGSITDPSRQSKVVMFFDSMRLLSQPLRITESRIKTSIGSRAHFNNITEVECRKECKKDSICSTFTYKTRATESENNCWLYSRRKVSCQGSKKNNCNMFSYSKYYMTEFRID